MEAAFGGSCSGGFDETRQRPAELSCEANQVLRVLAKSPRVTQKLVARLGELLGAARYYAHALVPSIAHDDLAVPAFPRGQSGFSISSIRSTERRCRTLNAEPPANGSKVVGDGGSLEPRRSTGGLASTTRTPWVLLSLASLPRPIR